MDKFRDRLRKKFSVSLIAQIGCKCDFAMILQRMANEPDGGNDDVARTICVRSDNEQTELVLEVMKKTNEAYLAADSNAIAIDPCIMYRVGHL